MKRLILSASVIMLGLAALAPAALATRQVSVPSEISDDATITDLVRHNRDSRSHK